MSPGITESTRRFEIIAARTIANVRTTILKNTMLPPPYLNIEFVLDICWAADVDDGGHGLSGGVTQSKSFSLMQAPIRGDR